jgi:hypothetical protein
MYSSHTTLPLFQDHSVLDVLKKRQQEIKRLADFYEAELRKINAAFQILSASAVKRVKWTREALQFLSEKKEMVQTVDILEWVFRDQSAELEIPGKRRIYLTGLSVALNNLFRNNKICRVMIPGKKGYYYGLSAWFENDRTTLKPGFIINVESNTKKHYSRTISADPYISH